MDTTPITPTPLDPDTQSSSQGNSDLDDQVDRYIRDQRFATLISDNPTTNRPNLLQSHITQQRDRNIALFHRLIANLPSPITLDPELFATARAYISDIAHSDPAHHVTYFTLPTRFRNLVLNNVPTAPALPINNTASYPDGPYIDPLPPPLVQDLNDDDIDSDDVVPPPLTTLTDDEHNILTRRYHPRPTQTYIAPDDHLLYDIHVATHTYDSDSTHLYSELDDASDEDHLPYWPAQAPPTRPLAAPYPPANLTDAQTIQWTPLAPQTIQWTPQTQMPWHLWLRQQIFLGHIPNEQRGPTPRDAKPQSHATSCGSVYRHTHRHPTCSDTSKATSHGPPT